MSQQGFEHFKTLLKDVSEYIDQTPENFMEQAVATSDDIINLLEGEEAQGWDDDIKEKIKLFALVMQGAECVDEYGGEGQGDNYYAVWSFPHLNLYVQFDGWYASHMGSEYQTMFEVSPMEVTKIEYHKV